MTDIIEDAGAYEQWDPKHPNFVKNYKKYKQNNPDGKLKDFVDHMKNKPTQLPEEYDIESMLEYIEQLESALEESLASQMGSELSDKLGAKIRSGKQPTKVNSKPTAKFVAGASRKPSDDTCDSKSGKSYVESIESMLESVIAGDLVESKQSFVDILGSKIAARLAEAKIAIAQGLFGIVESKDEDEDDEPKSKLSPEEQEKADDKAGAEFNSKHELGQLSAISSSEEGIPLKYPETVASGEPDKRSIRAATDRIKSGKSTSGVPTYKHANGEESKIDPKTAKGLHLLFTHPNGYKKDHKERLLKLIHSSKSGYQQAAKEIISDRQNPEKSKHKFTQSNTEDKART
jgi:hypothetical protein